MNGGPPRSLGPWKHPPNCPGSTSLRDSVEDYLAFCEQRGETPEKPFSGQFVTRISPDLHRQIHVAARLSGKSLNAWVADQLQRAVLDQEPGEASPAPQGRSKSAKQKPMSTTKLAPRRNSPPRKPLA